MCQWKEYNLEGAQEFAFTKGLDDREMSNQVKEKLGQESRAQVREMEVRQAEITELHAWLGQVLSSLSFFCLFCLLQAFFLMSVEDISCQDFQERLAITSH